MTPLPLIQQQLLTHIQKKLLLICSLEWSDSQLITPAKKRRYRLFLLLIRRTGMLFSVTVTFLDFLGGTLAGFALELFRLLAAFTFLAHDLPPHLA